jgi:Fe-S-cluster-containing hydrogenase component 2
MKTYEQNGILTLNDLDLPSDKQLKKGVAIIECVQEIPCNPCVDACPFGAISMKDINAPPVVDYDKCTACGQCVGICPGLAIFVIKVVENNELITLPYEFYPVPEVGAKVEALNRKGEPVGVAIVRKVKKKDKTMIITIESRKNLAMEIRNIKV